MKPRWHPASVVAVALLVVGCGEDSLLAPAALHDAFAASRDRGDDDGDDFEGPFTAALDLTAPPTDPGRTTVVRGRIRTTGQVNQGPLTGDIQGTGTTVLDAEVDPATGLGSARGSFVLNITRVRGKAVVGTWKGRFEGRIDGAVFAGTFRGVGTGALRGTRIRGTFSDGPTGGDLFRLEGRIAEGDDDDDDGGDDDDEG